MRGRPGTPTLAIPILAALALAPAAGADAEAGAPAPLEWERVADVDVIEVLTRDDDGDLRETKVWFVLIDGQSYLRTNRSRWLENIRRDPDVAVRIEGVEYPVRAEILDSEAWVERVDAASREKYGWQEALIHPFRMRTPDILRVVPR